MLNTIIRHLKQLCPLFVYRTRYGVPADGTEHFVVWRMFLGRCFDVDDVVIGRGG